jgi:hypothetical protein
MLLFCYHPQASDAFERQSFFPATVLKAALSFSLSNNEEVVFPVHKCRCHHSHGGG